VPSHWIGNILMSQKIKGETHQSHGYV